MKLTFDKKNVTLNVSRGDTGASLLKQLEKKLPKGYEARVLAQQGKDFTIGIAKKAALESSFYPNPKALGDQKGTMTFTFVL